MPFLQHAEVEAGPAAPKEPLDHVRPAETDPKLEARHPRLRHDELGGPNAEVVANVNGILQQPGTRQILTKHSPRKLGFRKLLAPPLPPALEGATVVVTGTLAGYTREEWLEAIEKRDLISIDLDIKQAVDFDSVIVGTVEARWRVSYLGRAVEDRVLLTDVWVCEEGRWQVVRRHSSPIPTLAGDRQES